MINEEIKAPVIDGFELVERNVYGEGNPKSMAFIRIKDTFFYYHGIKPKEKSMREVANELFPGDIYNSRAIEANVKLLNWIDSNYVKKEG